MDIYIYALIKAKHLSFNYYNMNKYLNIHKYTALIILSLVQTSFELNFYLLIYVVAPNKRGYKLNIFPILLMSVFILIMSYGESKLL